MYYLKNLYPLLFLFALTITSFSQQNESNDVTTIDQIKPKSTIGCIFPLSGENSLIGERAMRGIESALSLTGKNSDYELVVKDINNSEINILNSYTDLAVNYKPHFIIGPIRSNAVKAVSKIVERHKVPTMTFPVYRDNTQSSPFMVKFFYPIDEQVVYLSDYAIKTLKLKNFAILYPKTKLGKKFKDKFIDYSKRQGARIVHIGEYDLDMSDIEVEISWVKSFQPDAILIPDYPSRSASIIKKILNDKTYLNVLFLGPNTWNSTTFAEMAGDEIDGLLHKAIFTDFLVPGSIEWKEFYNHYKKTYSSEPSFFEYQIYEGTRMFLNLSGNPGSKKYRLISNIMKMRGKGKYIVNKNKFGLEVYPKPHLISLEDKKLLKLK